jgi:hypothetical protein
MTDTQEVPQWKLDLIAQAQKLLEAREERIRKANREVLDWIETQPPEIKNTSIGK